MTGFLVPPNKAIVGANAFRHESGIHQDGVLKEKSTYEIMSPESVGVPVGNLFLGKHSGRHAFKVRLKALGIELKDAELDKAFHEFKKLADQKKQVFDEDLLAIVEDEVKIIKPTWELVDFTNVSGMNRAPKVEVTLKSKGKKFSKSSTGDGPVDACYKAIDKITGVKGELLDYSIQSFTEGQDALGEVTVKVKIDGKSVISRASSTDIIVASAKAYLNAVSYTHLTLPTNREV